MKNKDTDTLQQIYVKLLFDKMSVDTCKECKHFTYSSGDLICNLIDLQPEECQIIREHEYA